MISQAKGISGDITEETDVVVIGSGAGGGPFAYEMAKAGKRVVILEAGGYYTSADFSEEEMEMVNKLYVDGGNQGPADGSIHILQGKCVGGSSTVNAMMCFHPPEKILNKWAQEHGVSGLSLRDLMPAIEEVEEIIHVHEALPHEINAANRLVMKGCDKLGWHNAPLRRNTKECLVSGACMMGCAYDRKRSVLVTFVPLAVEASARLYADAEVQTIHAKDGRATGVTALVKDRDSGAIKGQLTVNAKVVVVSAGAIQTPCILQRSGLANSSGMVGRNLAVHPGIVTGALFEQQLNAWRGGVCGSYSAEFADDAKGGYYIEGGTMGPAMGGQMLPGCGEDYREIMRQYSRIATGNAIVHDSCVGQVTYNPDTGRADIDYEMDEDTARRSRDSIKQMARMWFAAGARRVYTPFVDPLILDSVEEIDRIDERSMGPNQLTVVSYHPQATVRMGADPRTSVINSQGECHDVRNLFVADASIFPTSIAVNPQISVMAISMHFARGILADQDHYFS